MVHFFLYDYKFEDIWINTEKYVEILGRYSAVLTPDFSMYLEMNPVLQLYNTFRNRWCGAYLADKGLRVVPTVNWGLENTFDFCFNGIEKDSAVAVSTYMVTAHNNYSDQKEFFLKGYNNQGIHYENDTLYVPLFGYNSNATPNPNKPKENVILVYGGIDNAIANTQIDSISNSKAVTIEAVNTDISLFEIESIGFPVNNPNLNNDLLWFNTNKKIGVDRVNGGIYCDSQDIK